MDQIQEQKKSQTCKCEGGICDCEEMKGKCECECKDGVCKCVCG